VTALRLVVLASGAGRSLQNLIDLAGAGRLPARIVHVVGSKAGIPALDRARKAGIEATVCGPADLTGLIDRLDPDLVVMAGWLKHWPIPDRWVGRTINIHPALLPAFGGRGLYGHRVHDAVLAAGVPASGCTVHFVTGDYDAGPVILQRTCPVLAGDTSDALAARVFAEELVALPEAITAIAEGRVRLVGGKVFTAPSVPPR
jgi:formyltetrahydrofolate-dependent phosphoribosylglycinamide formyltransferase